MIVKQLLGDYVLITPEKTTEKTSATGIISQVVDNTEHRGEVLQVGPGLFAATGIRIPLTVEVGDVVKYKKSTADVRTIGDKKYDLIREGNIELVEYNVTDPEPKA